MVKVFLCDVTWQVFEAWFTSGDEARCTIKAVAGFTFRGGARFSVLPVEEETAGLQTGARGGRLIFQTELTQLSQLLERDRETQRQRRMSN